MRKATLLLIFLSWLFVTAREAQAPHVVPARVGLVLIGATQEGFALAADGSSLNADGRVSQEQKLFQAGKSGVVAISGSVSIQDPVGKRVRDEVNIARVTGAWLAAHPEADIQTVDREVNAAVSAAVNKFLSTRDPGAERGMFKFAIAAAGLVEGKPTVMVTRYFLPSVKGKALRTERTSAPAKTGELWVLGSSSVPMELLTGRSNLLAKAKADPAVKKFHSSPNSTLAGQDYINLFDRVLNAAESDQGKKMDGKRAIVAAPNHYAMLTAKDGFAWSTPN